MEKILPFMTNVQLYGWVLIIVGLFIRNYLTTVVVYRLKLTGCLIALAIALLHFFSTIGMWLGAFLLVIEWYNKR